MGIQRGGAAGSPRTCPWSVIVGGECGGGESGRGGGVAGVAVREGRVLHPWGDRGGAAGAVRVNCTGRDFGKQIEGHLCSDIKSTEIYRKLWKVTGSRKIRVC